MIRSAKEQDIPQIARVHKSALFETLISKMGTSILERLYSTLLHQDNARIYLIEDNQQIVGVASWALNYRIALDRSTQKMIIEKIIHNPKSWLGVIERSLTGQYIKLFFGYEPWLLTLAVVGKSRGKGSGTKLVEQVCKDVRMHGQSSLLVETILAKQSVVSFYEKLGFVRVKKIGPNIILRKTL